MSLFHNIKNIAITGASSLLNIFTSIFRSKAIAILIGTQGFALIGQLTNLIMISTNLITFGMGSGLIKEVSEARSKNDHQAILQFRTTLLLFSTTISIILAFSNFIFAKEVCAYLFKSLDYLKYVKITSLLILSIGLTTSYETFLNADKKVKSLAKKAMIFSTLSSVISVVLIYFYGLDGTVYGLVLNAYLNIFISAYFLSKNQISLFDAFNIKANFKNKSLRTLLKYGSVLMLSSILYQFVHIELKNIITVNLSLEKMGLYQAMNNITNQYLPIFVTSISVYFLPHLSEQFTIKEKHRELNLAIKSILIVAALPLFIIVTFDGFILSVLYKDSFRAGAQLFSFFTFFALFNLVNKILMTYIISIRSLAIILIMDVFVAGTILMLANYLFIEYTLLAPVLALIGATCFHMTLILIYLYFKNNFKLTIETLKTIFLTFTFLASIQLSKNYVDVTYTFLIGIGLIILFYLINISKQELNAVIEKIKAKFKK